MLRNSAYVVLTNSQVVPSILHYVFHFNKLFARYKMVNLNDLVGFALTLTACYKKESNWESRV